jgi:hypothetical protein
MNPARLLEWTEAVDTGHGPFTMRCILRPEHWNDGVLAGRPYEQAKQRLVRHLAIHAVRAVEPQPRPGQHFRYCYPDPRAEPFR